MPPKKGTKTSKAKARKPKKNINYRGVPAPEDLDVSNLLTPSQTAEILGVSPRTLARWAIAFEKSLSSTASRRGRKRFFSSYDIQQLQEAVKLIGDGLTIEATAQSLTIVDEKEVATTAMVLTPEVAGQVATVVERTDNMVSEINRLREQTAQQQAIIERLNARLSSLEAHESKSVLERAVSKYKKPDYEETGFQITGTDGTVEIQTYRNTPIVEELPPKKPKGEDNYEVN
jgi:DNA-binding transcriptional MerR regulator